MGKHRSIALENESIVATGFYTVANTRVDIAEAVAKSCQGVRSYTPTDTERLLREQGYQSSEDGTEVEITPETSTQASQRLVLGERETGVGLLNFASARNPGGGYLGGARAQEEDICRSSALYTTLLEARDYYDAHRAVRDARYSHRVIFSPDVPVYRDNRGALLEAPYPVSFLTSPAPNVGALSRDDPRVRPDVRGLIVERAARVLAVAAHHGVGVLILGAWGCGVFRNDPADVAGVFASHLGEGGAFHGRFSRVVFAVYDTSPGQTTIGAFRTAFPKGPHTRHVDFPVARTT